MIGIIKTNAALGSIWVILLLASSPALSAPLIIDDFNYLDDNAARAAWQEMAGSLPVSMGDSGDWGNEKVMKLPCDFSLRPDRSYWDRSGSLDLSGYWEVALEVFVPDPAVVSQFIVYFHSGAGWYSNSKTISQLGWQTLYFALVDFSTESNPSGWDQVDTIRLSPWKGSDQDSYLAVRELRAFTPRIFIVRDTQAADSRTVDNAIETLSGWLGRYNVSFGVIDDTAVEQGYLQGSQLVILPYNQVISDTGLTRLEEFVAAGGKLMVFYQLDGRIADLLGIDATGWMPGDFAAYTFADAVIQHLPQRVLQNSWNITIASPRAQMNARVIASWEDSLGIPTGHPAWLASDNGLFMSHVILADDPETKQYMLLALIGHFVPEIWPQAAAAAIENIGKIADYISYNQAVLGVLASGSSMSRALQVQSELDQADSDRQQALDEFADSLYPQAVLTAKSARSHLLEAYYLCQTPVTPEFRAVWEHGGTGPYPGDWESSIKVLWDNNFTAVFPNMLWGGLAHYASDLLPRSDEYDAYGDQIADCVTAAHAKGIEVHVWKVNWNLSTAPQAFIDSMHAAARTQVTDDGLSVDWLCPSHPGNFALERDSMLEVVKNYDVDGIHFDYIRYPNSKHCYCDGCRARFEQQTGNTVASWPADVITGGPWESQFLDWRREQITNLVEAVYLATKAVKPEVQVSAAVFSNYSYAFDGVGQDWVSWINRGIVDFLCPMDYTNDFDRFENLVSEQLEYASGRVPIYPGIGASTSSSFFGPDGVIVQILTTRALDTSGFIIFNYDRSLAEQDLPALGKGTTATPEQDGGTDGGGIDGGPAADQEVDAGIDGGGDDKDGAYLQGDCGCGGGKPSQNCFLLLCLLVLARKLVIRH